MMSELLEREKSAERGEDVARWFEREFIDGGTVIFKHAPRVFVVSTRSWAWRARTNATATAYGYVAFGGRRLLQALHERDECAEEPNAQQIARAEDVLKKITRLIIDEIPNADRNRLPQIAVNVDSDGALLLEWQFRENRIDYVIDADGSESGTYLVDCKNLDDDSRDQILELDDDSLRQSVRFAYASLA